VAGTLSTVPPVEGLSAFQAMDAILLAGLRLGEAIPTKGPLGLVVETRPAAGTQVRPGTRVKVWVGVSKERLKYEH
jgi:beta-lactam-binding protein with PASTA domain